MRRVTRGVLAAFLAAVLSIPAFGQPSIRAFGLTGDPVPNLPGATYGSVQTFTPAVINNAGEAFWLGALEDGRQYLGSSDVGAILLQGQELSPGVTIDRIFDFNASKHGGATVAQVALAGDGITSGMNDLAIVRSDDSGGGAWTEVIRQGEVRNGDTIGGFLTPLVAGGTIGVSGFATSQAGTPEQFVLFPSTPTTPERYLSTNPDPPNPSTLPGVGDYNAGTGAFLAIAFGLLDPNNEDGLVHSTIPDPFRDRIDTVNLADGSGQRLVETGDPTDVPGVSVGDLLTRIQIDPSRQFLYFQSTDTTTDERFIGVTQLPGLSSGARPVKVAIGPFGMAVPNLASAWSVLPSRRVRVQDPTHDVLLPFNVLDCDIGEFGGGCQVVLQDGDPIGDAPDAMKEFQTFGNGASSVTNAVGQTVLLAPDGLACDEFGCGNAIYVIDANGSVRSPLSEGEQIDLAQGIRELESLGFFLSEGAGEGGDGVSLNDRGQLAIPAAFESFTSGLLVLGTWAADLPGDYNADGEVTAIDYTLARDQQGQSAAGTPNNIDGDVFNANHIRTWQSYYLSRPITVGDSQTVPEPSTAMLVAIGLAITSAPARAGVLRRV